MQWRLFVLLAIGLACFSVRVEATHFRYGNLSWEPTGAQREVEFHLTVAYRRDYDFTGTGLNPFTGPDNLPVIGDTFSHASINFGDLTSSGALRFVVTAYSVTDDFIIGELLDPTDPTWTRRGLRHTYSSDSLNSNGDPFVAVFESAARLSGLNNRGDGTYRLQTAIRFDGNRAPKTTLVPIVVVPESPTASFLIPATDPDGNTLRFRIATTGEAGGGNSPPNLSVNPTTGLVTWDTRGLNQSRFWTVQVVIEDLDSSGNARTQTPVDFLLQISNQAFNTPPAGALNPPGPFSINAGQPFTFSVIGNDVDPGSTVTINSGGLPSGATTTPSLPASGSGTGTTVAFNWTPTNAQFGNYPVVFSITDEHGAQALVQTVIVVRANTVPAGTLIAPGPFTINTGEPLTFTLAASDPDAGSTVTVDSDSLPAGATVSPSLPATGPGAGFSVTFDWTPLSTQAGDYPVTFSVTDDQGARIDLATNITVILQPRPLGGFSGFVADSQGNTGTMTLRVAADGTLSGSLKLTPGGSFAINRFRLDANNQFRLDLAKGVVVKGVTVGGTLRVEITNGADVFDGVLVASLRRQAKAGCYTMLLPPDPARASDLDVPQGTGFAVGFADATGRIRFAGATADGKKFGTGSGIRSDGSVPFFAKLDSGRSSRLHGSLTFSEKVGSDFDGSLAWVKPPVPGDAFYPRGFATELAAIGSRYSKPRNQTGILELGGGGSVAITFTGGNLAGPVTQSVAVRTAGDSLVVRPLRWFTLSKGSGLFGGYFVHENGLSRLFQGVAFQKENRGGGFFLGTDIAGTVTLAP